jgi:hypothetical protein
MNIPAASRVAVRDNFSSRQRITINQHDAALNKAEGNRAQNAEGPPARTNGRSVKYPSGTPPGFTRTQRIRDSTDGEVVPNNSRTSSSHRGLIAKEARSAKL